MKSLFPALNVTAWQRLRFLSVTIVLFLAASPVGIRAEVVINEIMYHPLQPQFGSEPIGEEFVELFNTSTNAVNLNGWRFNKGLSFTFTNVTLAAGGYLVVSPNLAAFNARYPGVTNVVGNWTGILGNNGDSIELKNALGDVVDSVAFGTEGDWAQRQRGPDDLSHRGWKWYSPADGLGKSMERRNPFLTNSSGQNFVASVAMGGTPGRINGAFTNNVAPLILGVTHFPLVPASTQAVTIAAHIVDEQTNGLTVTLFWRVDSTTPPPFTAATMFDDGGHNDGGANDGVYAAIIPAQANNAVIEFYVAASDAGGRANTWPGPVIAAPDNAGPTGQVANALYQVDNNPQNAYGALSPTHPVYKLIMTENERAELAGIPCSGSENTDAEMNGTWITLDGTGQELRYRCGFRNRGHGSRCATPPNYRVNIPNDNRWKGIRALNVNSVNTPAQILGAAIAKKAGLAGADSHAGQVRVNNVNRASTGTDMLGAYAINEEMDSDWAKEHFPLDSAGNIYRAIRDIAPPDWVYRGPNVNSYVNTYFKTDNNSAYDWSDLIQLHRIVGTNDLFTTANVQQVANVEEWMTFYAVESLFGNQETSPNTGYNDDYFMYRGVNDPRFLLIYYDNDTILSSLYGALGANGGIFSAEAPNGMGAMTTRFLEWPDFKPRYYAALQRMLDTAFSQPEFDSVVDETLGTYPATSQRASVISSVKSYMSTRRTTVQSLINGLVPPATNNPVATISGEPRSPTPFDFATLTVGGNGIVAYKYKVNNGSYSAEIPVATPISLSSLPNNSSVTVYVIGRNSVGVYQDATNATVSKTWLVKTSWPKVRLNEVLARNDSAVSHNGTFPDIIELYNEGTSSINISGMRLTDDPANPNKFAFPASTNIAAGDYLIVYANDPDGTPGFHTGFALGQNGAAVYLYDAVANGGQLLDSVVFGLQVADLSIGRFNDGDWRLCLPSFGATNVARTLGVSSGLKVNEWLTSGSLPFVDDFIEIYNPDTAPVALGGMYLTDEPIGAPQLHRIADLSFVAGGGHATFIADGNTTAGADHLGFSLSSEQGEIGLNGADLSKIDTVSYGPQSTGIAQGRCPDGSAKIAFLTTPTPGAPNLCPATPPPPITIGIVSYTNVWKYDQTNNYDGVPWNATNYNDTAWASGAGVLARVRPGGTISQPVNTLLNTGRITYYFRTSFMLPTNANLSQLQITHIIDDGAVVYLNGQEAYRYNLSGTVTYSTLAAAVNGDPQAQGPFNLPMTNLVAGLNYLAVEVHQTLISSADVVFGLKLDGVIVTNSPVSAGIIINEVLANNATVEELDGSTPDWIELYNPSANAVDLANASLSDTTLNPRRFVFPSPTLLPAQGFLVVRFDSGAPVSLAPPLNTGFGLKASGSGVYLFSRPEDGGSVLDFVTFGLQTKDFSIGRYPLGTSNWVLTLPSGGAPNSPAPLGDPSKLKINEWMASPVSGDDWFEVYNPDTQPIALGGLWLTDDLSDRQKSQIPALSFMGANTNGYQKFDADNNVGAGADHAGFKLAGQSGEAIGISYADGTLIDGITFGPQDTGVSEGRLPDGSSNIVRFPETSSPGDANYLILTDVVVNEVLSHTDLPLEDAIELYNTTGSDINIGGWFLSDAKTRLRKFAIPAGTVITAGGYAVFYEYQFNDPFGPLPFALSSAKGDEVYLSAASSDHQLNGYRASVKFGPAENGVSFGRFETSVGVDFPAMSDLSLGTSVRAGGPTNLISVFRMGHGAVNPYPKIGPVVISEIMYHPPDLSTNDNVRDEFIELYNIADHPVALYDPNFPTNTWRLRDAVDFDFPLGLTMPAGGFLIVVSYDPATNATALLAFRQQYGTNGILLGPYSGKLDNGGESVELYKPDPPQPADGFVPYVLVERVHYTDSAPWSTNADGFGYSLQRLNVYAYGNEPLNWAAALPTVGRALDRDNDGLPDWWEIIHGLDPLNGADANEDTDHDGLKNWEEFMAGTDPQDPQSFLKIEVVSASESGALLRFNAVANKTYSVLWRNVVPGMDWTPLTNITVQSSQQVTVPDPDSNGQRFYRLMMHE